MNTKDTTINDNNFKKLVHNEEYYRNIFKKTEKVISVVFYILNNIDANKKSETHISNLAGKSHFAHENALRSLEVKMSNSKEVLEQFAQALIALDSTLRVTSASGVITNDVLYVVTNEIDTVLRGLSKYIAPDVGIESSFMMSAPGPSAAASSSATPARQVVRKTPVKSAEGQNVPTTTMDRRTRIQTILEAKGEATIKDISEIITDCSEKTLQRELNAMIEDMIVKRQGERRWSKYSIA
ncbi:MAG: hypothetical protein ACI9H6_000068 [Patiriisocius sp.]|jgi:hypothetical protein